MLNPDLVPPRARITREAMLLDKFLFVNHIPFLHCIIEEGASFNEAQLIPANCKKYVGRDLRRGM